MRNVVINQSGVGVSAWAPVDRNLVPFNLGYAAVITGSPTYAIEYTYDNVFDPSITPTAFKAQTGKTANQDGAMNQPIVAMRINITAVAVSGAVKLTLVQGK